MLQWWQGLARLRHELTFKLDCMVGQANHVYMRQTQTDHRVSNILSKLMLLLLSCCCPAAAVAAAAAAAAAATAAAACRASAACT